MLGTVSGWGCAWDKTMLSPWQTSRVMKIKIFCDVALYCSTSSALHFKVLQCSHLQGVRVLQNVCNFLSSDTVSLCRGLESSETPLWELHISHCTWCLCINHLIRGCKTIMGTRAFCSLSKLCRFTLALLLCLVVCFTANERENYTWYRVLLAYSSREQHYWYWW